MPPDAPPDEVLPCVVEDTAGSEELFVVTVLDTDDEPNDEPSLPGCAFALPKNVLDSSDERTGFAGYVGGPKEGELEEELDLDELLEDDTEVELSDEVLEDELSSGSLSVEELVCELCEGSSVEV